MIWNDLVPPSVVDIIVLTQNTFIHPIELSTTLMFLLNHIIIIMCYVNPKISLPNNKRMYCIRRWKPMREALYESYILWSLQSTFITYFLCVIFFIQCTRFILWHLHGNFFLHLHYIIHSHNFMYSYMLVLLILSLDFNLKLNPLRPCVYLWTLTSFCDYGCCNWLVLYSR